jgi:hypothetical protein
MTIAPFLFTWRNSQPPRPNKPYAPSRVRISAYVDGDAVVVSSTISVMVQVTVTDQLTGDCPYKLHKIIILLYWV